MYASLSRCSTEESSCVRGWSINDPLNSPDRECERVSSGDDFDAVDFVAVRPSTNVQQRLNSRHNATVSIGIAYAREAAIASDALFASADEALYAAKNGDRDKFKVMECNVIDLARRPSRRRSDA